MTVVLFAMANEKEYPVVLVRCRRGRDGTTFGQECDGTQAYNMSAQGDFTTRLKCVKCGHVWVIPVGGTLNLPPGV